MSSGYGQTWICTRRRWDTLSPLWRSHGHAHRRGPRLDPHGHWLMAIARVHGVHSAADHILQCERLGKYGWASLVPAPLSNQPSTDPTQHPFHIFTKPGPVRWTKQHPILDRPTTSPSISPSNSLSCFLTKTPSYYPSQGAIQNFRPKLNPDFPAGYHSKLSNQSPLMIPQPWSISNFQPKILAHRPARVHLKNFQETSMYRPEDTSNYYPSKITSQYPSYTPFRNSLPKNPLPHTQPTTHSKLLPSLPPPLLHLTHGLFHLGGHTGHTELAIKTGSHLRVQLQMKLCIHPCAGVKKRF